MNTAKQNFDNFVFNNQTLYEATKQQCEQKMATLEGCKISFAVWWTMFWLFFGFGIIGLIFSLFFNMSNYSKRTNYKDVELMRLQMKVNKFNEFEIAQQKFQQEAKEKNPEKQNNNENVVNKPVSIVMPTRRQLDFSNLAKEKLIQLLELSHISYLAKDTLYQLGEIANANNIAWNKAPEILLKEVLDVNGITYKLNITKADMVKLLE